MKPVFLRTNFPNGRQHILLRDEDIPNPELNHYVLVLSSNGTLWVDVFWPYDETAEKHTKRISESEFWRLFREWRLDGLKFGDSERVAHVLARRLLSEKTQKKADV